MSEQKAHIAGLAAGSVVPGGRALSTAIAVVGRTVVATEVGNGGYREKRRTFG